MKSSSIARFSLIALFTSFAMSAIGQTVPVATVTSTKTLVSSVSGSPGHIAVNSFGDVFYVAGSATLYELPHGSTTPVALETSLSSATGVGVDRANNVYISSPSQSRLVEIPYVAGSGYAASFANSSSIPACVGVNTAVTAPCVPVSNGGAVTGTSLQTADTAFDAAGNLYLVNFGTGASACAPSTTCNQILQYGIPVSRSTTPVLLGGGIVNPTLAKNAKAEIAADSLGNLYYADGTNLYTLPVDSTSKTGHAAVGPVLVQGGFTAVTGVTIDALGNLYIVDQGRIVVYPSLNGVPQPSDAYTLASVSALGGVGVDGSGRLYYASASGANSILSVLIPGRAEFGSVASGSTSAATTLTVYFDSAATPTSIALSSQSAPGFAITGGTCAKQAYAAGSTCTITVTYTPSGVGLQSGAVVIGGASGNIVTANLSGVGTGTAITIDPGVTAAFGSSWKSPSGVAIDAVGNVYVADTKANAVYRFAKGSTTGVTLGSGLASPSAVAVDGAGNLYIADSGNGRVLELPVQNGVPATSAQFVVFPSPKTVPLVPTKGTTGVFVDSTGSLFIADSGNGRVLRLANYGGTLDTGTFGAVGTGFTGPVAVVTDAQNNVYVADQAGNAVYSFVLGSTSMLSISPSISSPSGLALDASGSLYVADTGNHQVLKLPSESGFLNPNDAISVALSVQNPNSIALDGAGNLYVTDGTAATVSQIARTQSAITFGNVDTGSVSSQIAASVSSSGNVALTFGTPGFTQSGATAPFKLVVPSAGGCSSALVLQPGFSCSLQASFAPTATGTFVDTMAFTANASNTASPQLVLSGVGATPSASSQTVLTITSPSNGSPQLGQAVVFQAAIAATNGSTPTGTVQFILDGYQIGAPVTVASGKAMISVTGLGGGTHVIVGTYSGGAGNDSSTSSTLIFTVGKTTTPVALVVTSTYGSAASPPQSSIPGTLTTLTATLTQATRVLPPGGTVTFYNNYGTSSQQQLGSVAAVSSALTAKTQFTPSAAATYNITAVYNGDLNYLTAASAAVPLVIAQPGYLLYPTNATLTIPSGGSGTLTITVDEYSGISGALSVLCTSGLPVDTTCSPNPAEFSVNPARGRYRQPIVVTFQTGVVPVVPLPPYTAANRLRGGGELLAILFLAPVAFCGRRRATTKRLRHLLGVLIVFAVGVGCVGLTSCSSSSYFGYTPPGTYNVVLTTVLSANGLDYPQTTNVTLIVK